MYRSHKNSPIKVAQHSWKLPIRLGQYSYSLLICNVITCNGFGYSMVINSGHFKPLLFNTQAICRTCVNQRYHSENGFQTP